METKSSGRGKGGDRKGRREADESPTGRVDEVKVVVERGQGVNVVKVSKVDRGNFRTLSVGYLVEFEGHPAIPFGRLGEARDRAKQPVPELASPVVQAVTEAA